ncbi:hypothetical protein ACFY4I_10575 [Streptomyces scabiei]|uniref:hypothetical protein n=1 Tax=Streptomyces scabiei TaxID=1930 RepID=UPI0036861575
MATKLKKPTSAITGVASGWGAWSKPSLAVVPAVPPPPQAVAVSTTVAAQPASSADLLLRTLFPRRLKA